MSKTKTHTLTDDQRWTLYHLLRGGMNKRKELSAAIGVSLAGVCLQELFLQCDNALAEPRSLAKPVWCGNCGEFINTVPCQRCHRTATSASYRMTERREKPKASEPEPASESADAAA